MDKIAFWAAIGFAGFLAIVGFVRIAVAFRNERKYKEKYKAAVAQIKGMREESVILAADNCRRFAELQRRTNGDAWARDKQMEAMQDEIARLQSELRMRDITIQNINRAVDSKKAKKAE